jgi:hypothetical protein
MQDGDFDRLESKQSLSLKFKIRTPYQNRKGGGTLDGFAVENSRENLPLLLLISTRSDCLLLAQCRFEIALGISDERFVARWVDKHTRSILRIAR